MDHSVRCTGYCLFDSRQLKRPANHPSFNEVFNLLSRERRWLISSTGFRESSTSMRERLH
jgi:hypothetical protein